jgi:hypothetical protein
VKTAKKKIGPLTWLKITFVKKLELDQKDFDPFVNCTLRALKCEGMKKQTEEWIRVRLGW